MADIDFRTVNVDNLPDQQIQQILDEGHARGMNIEQISAVAIQQGLPRSEAMKLRQRLREVQGGGTGEGGVGATDRVRDVPPDPERAERFDRMFGGETGADSLRLYQTIEQIRYQNEQSQEEISRQRLRDRIFGYDLFQRAQGGEANFQPNMNIATPSDYQLGTGDQIIVDLWGAAETTYTLQISPEGTVNIQNLGPVYLNGLSIEEARQRLLDRLNEIHSGLNPPSGEPDTFMQLSLGQSRSISVTVLGEATVPGTYQIPALATVFNALYSAGGPSVTGSFRRIDVLRGDSIATSFDLYDLLIHGDQSANIRLRNNDIIQIRPYVNRVAISGEVKRDGLFEMKNQETLADLIDYAGDFTNQAYTGRVKVVRNTPTQKRIADIDQDNFDQFEMSNGDSVIVGEILDRYENIVEIEGAVFRPGPYELTDTTTLHSLIQRADGLMGDAFLARGIIYRELDDYTIESIAFNLAAVMQNPEANDIDLMNRDRIRISSIFDMRENYTVQISGPVLDPGSFEFAYGMTLQDLIFAADGFRESAAPYQIEVARRIKDGEGDLVSDETARIFEFQVDESLQLSEEEANFELEPFDRVYIRELPNYETQREVKVVGEVRYPGTYTLSSKNERISDLIQRAGGLTGQAYLAGATLFRERDLIQQEAQQVEANLAATADVELEQQGITQVGIRLPEVIRTPGSKYDLYMERGDSLFIPTELQTVTVTGGVFYPTTIRFDSRYGFMEYISQAGGFNDLARKNDAYIVYANGEVDRTKKFLFIKDRPNVRPGATIVIPEDDPTVGLSPQERVSLFSAIISTAALVATTIVQITR